MYCNITSYEKRISVLKDYISALEKELFEIKNHLTPTDTHETINEISSKYSGIHIEDLILSLNLCTDPTEIENIRTEFKNRGYDPSIYE